MEAVLPRRGDELGRVGETTDEQSEATEIRHGVTERDGRGQHGPGLLGLEHAIGDHDDEGERRVEGQPARDGPTVDERRGDEPAEDGGGGVLGVPVEGGRDAQRVGENRRRRRRRRPTPRWSRGRARRGSTSAR